MDVLIFIVFVIFLAALFVGYISLQHAIIKPVVDWMYPVQPEHEPEADTTEDPQVRMWREGRERREAWRVEQQKEGARRDKEQRRLEARIDRQDAADAARAERERERFWREMEALELKSGIWDRNWWAAFHKERGTKPHDFDAAPTRAHQSTGPRKSGKRAPGPASRNASR